MAQERLQKIIARAGIASRRAAERLITEGRVRVNGERVTELGSRADTARDTVEVEGYGALNRQPRVYLALHKPQHVVSTAKDPEGRTTVLDVITESRPSGRNRHEGELPRVFPIGRLDFDAEGLILLTNDGDLAHRLMHPRHHVPKTYLVKVKGRPDDKALGRLRRGVRLPGPDGKPHGSRTKPADVQVFRQSPQNTWLEMTITEGRNHQIKRMCQAVGLWVIRLVRTGFGGIEVDDLSPGSWRFLDKEEVASLRRWHDSKSNEGPSSAGK